MIPFDQWMRRALYHPETGYYRNGRDPFGKDGDFFTAAQIPLFGKIIAAEARDLCPGLPVHELGPGRGELAPLFPTSYTGIEYGEELPPQLPGFVFANEFFDALPVRVATCRAGELYELGVSGADWEAGSPLDVVACRYVVRYWPLLEEDGRCEIAGEALTYMERVARAMGEGAAFLAIDYGYNTGETKRFPQGTLMSYRRHHAANDVLADPGTKDITAHVPWDALGDRAAASGLNLVRDETLGEWVLRAVERDPALIAPPGAREQLKLLLFGMGESFRCLLWRKSKAHGCTESQ